VLGVVLDYHGFDSGFDVVLHQLQVVLEDVFFELLYQFDLWRLLNEPGEPLVQFAVLVGQVRSEVIFSFVCLEEAFNHFKLNLREEFVQEDASGSLGSLSIGYPYIDLLVPSVYTRGIKIDQGFQHHLNMVLRQVAEDLLGRLVVEVLRLFEVFVLVLFVHQVIKYRRRGSHPVPLDLKRHNQFMVLDTVLVYGFCLHNKKKCGYDPF
jgi:hypothetical protein